MSGGARTIPLGQLGIQIGSKDLGGRIHGAGTPVLGSCDLQNLCNSMSNPEEKYLFPVGQGRNDLEGLGQASRFVASPITVSREAYCLRISPMEE